MSINPPNPLIQETTPVEKASISASEKLDYARRVRAIFKSSLRGFGSWLYDHREMLTLLASWVGVVAAISLVVWQNKISREMAIQQNFMQFYQQWESDGMQERRARLAQALLQESTPTELDDSPLLFLETLSHATRRGLTDRELVWTTFSVDIQSYWPAAQKYVDQIRATEKCKCLYEELEALYWEFERRESQRRGESGALIGRDPESIRRFLNWEKQRKSLKS